MTVTRLQRNSETKEAQQLFNGPSEKSKLLTSCQKLFGKQLDDEEGQFWAQFLKPFPLAEVRYAFDNWNRNAKFFPKPKDIGDLCEAYRLSLAEQQTPIGCHRCLWTGYYETKREGYKERVVSPCPCRNNPALREKRIEHYGKGYGEKDMLWLFKKVQEWQQVNPEQKLEDAEIELLLNALDQKRGGAPEWRQTQ